jgi:UDP-N-acetyl-D-glucosamine dehydrogenase
VAGPAPLRELTHLRSYVQVHEKILAIHGGDSLPPHAPIVAVGAAYKPDVADTRESPAFDVVKHLREDFGYTVTHVDPLVPSMQPASASLASLCAETNAVALVVLVNHSSVLGQLREHGAEIAAALGGHGELVFTF